MSSRISIITSCKVTIVWGDYGVFLAFFHISSVPLTNARPASISKYLNKGRNIKYVLIRKKKSTYSTTEVTKGLWNTISCNGSSNLFWSRCYVEWNLGFESMLHGFFGDICTSAHVLIRTVCAWSDKSNFDVYRPAVLFGIITQFAYGVSQIWSEGAIDMGFQSV